MVIPDTIWALERSRNSWSVATIRHADHTWTDAQARWGVDPKLLNNGLHSGQPKVTFTESLYRKILVRRPVKNFVSFSARNGIAPSKEMQIESMDEHLRNGLWNAFLPILKVHTGYVLLHDIWIEFFKQPIDRLPRSSNDRRAMFRDDFFGSEWNKVYDLIEFVCAHDMSNLKRNKPKSYISDILLSDHIDASEFVKKCNSVLERETLSVADSQRHRDKNYL